MTKENWTIEIKPKKKWLDIDLKGIWRYRDLYYMYVKRDIVTVYKQTILGPLWFLIQPIFTTVMYMFIFGGLAGISTDGVPQPLFYMAGIMRGIISVPRSTYPPMCSRPMRACSAKSTSPVWSCRCPASPPT